MPEYLARNRSLSSWSSCSSSDRVMTSEFTIAAIPSDRGWASAKVGGNRARRKREKPRTLILAIESHREAASHFRLLEPYLDGVSGNERAAIFEDWARTEYYLISSESADILARAIALHRSTGNDVALAGALTLAVRVN